MVYVLDDAPQVMLFFRFLKENANFVENFQKSNKMETIKDFFISENNVYDISEDDYKHADIVVDSVKALARLTYKSIYIVDYYKKNFLYVSDNPIFLCGFQSNEVQRMGYSFYFQQVPKDELRMLLEINRAGFDFYSKTPIEERLNLYISYDFHLKDKGNNVLINHKLTPILLAPNGNIWLAACVISLSSNMKAGNIEARKYGSAEYWTYSMEKHRWVKQNNITLTQREKDIIKLSNRRYSEKEIADELCVSTDTVKYHKRSLFNKLGVSSIHAAIAVVSNSKLI